MSGMASVQDGTVLSQTVAAARRLARAADGTETRPNRSVAGGMDMGTAVKSTPPSVPIDDVTTGRGVSSHAEC